MPSRQRALHHASTAALLRHADGDEDAVRELHRRYAPTLHAFARHQGVPLACCDDAVNQAFERICRHGRCIDHASVDAQTWLVTMAARSFQHRR